MEIEWDLSENKPAAVVPVRGENRKDGFRSDDVPDGLITWEEHYEAHAAYFRAYPRGKSPETIANAGGFSFFELSEWLGHQPKSWIPRDMVKFEEFWKAMYAPAEEIPEPEPEVGPEPKASHIWYVDGVSICTSTVEVPTLPFNFDVVDGPACSKCLDRVLDWLRKWNGLES